MALTITDGLITLNDFVSFLGITSPLTRTSEYEDAIEIASRWAETYCGREFHTTASSARYFDTRDGYTVNIDDATAVTLVEYDSADSGTYSTLSASSYQLLPVGRNPLFGAVPYSAIRLLDWTPVPGYREGRFRVTGAWGWSAVPQPVQRAVALYAQDLIRDKDAEFGGVTVTEVGIVTARAPRRALDLLRPYVKAHNTIGLA